jgi:chemotaxis protein MotB
MARKHKHEDHVNHEAWAIPYGDLVTLLLAFFVVMYAMSSVNEGKYRVLSDSLNAAFSGAPRTMSPIQVGEKQVGNGADIHMSIVQQAMLQGQPRSMLSPPVSWRNMPANQAQAASPEAPVDRRDAELNNVAQQVERAMKELIDKNLIAVRRHGQWVEVEIRTDILFPSGIATLAPQAQAVVAQLGETLKPFPNPIRVEGHTDNRPISTLAFPSNWELSSARASSVVHTFTKVGVDPARLAVIGLGEFRPAQPNDTPQGRTANRRVLLIILGTDGAPPEGSYADDRGKPEEQVVAPPSTMSEVTITDAAPAIEMPMPVAPIAANNTTAP